MIVSDHSPTLAENKLLVDGPDYGNFIKSWGGIPGVQFGIMNLLFNVSEAFGFLSIFIDIDIEMRIYSNDYPLITDII